MRILVVAVLAVLAASCSDRATEIAAPTPDFARTQVTPAAGCPTPTEIRDLIDQVFPRGGDRSAAKARYNQILSDNSPTTAQHHALQLVEFLLNKFFDGQLIGGQSLATRTTLASLLNGILCQVGLPPLDPSVLDEDGAAAVISPTSPTTTLVTGTEWAGVTVPAGGVDAPALVTIRRLPDFPAPLFTPFDQYPLFYEFHITGGSLTTSVLVGACLANGVTPPDPSRLRLAHNVGTTVEILPLETINFLDCSDAGDIAATSSKWGFDLARGGLLLGGVLKSLVLPAPLHAATRRAGSGVGGTVRTFSPFGLVDTLGIVEAASPLSQPGVRQVAVASPPAVRLVTPTGQPMPGLLVDFAQHPIGAIVTGTPATSDVNGIAATTSWILGKEFTEQVTATVRSPAGTGFAGVPLLFVAVVQ